MILPNVIVIKNFLQNMTEVYYKVHEVLQSVTVITKWNVTKVIENIYFLLVLNFLNFMTLRNRKVQDKKLKTNIWSFYQNISRKMGRRNSFQVILHLYATWKIAKRYYHENLNLISFYRRTSWHVIILPVSLLQRNMWSYWKQQIFVEKIWPFFMT